MWGWLLLLLFLALVAALLWVPIRLYIDTDTHRYQLWWGIAFRARVVPIADDLAIRMRILGIPWRTTVIKLATHRNEEKTKKKRKARSRKKKKRKFSFTTFQRLLQSFRVHRCFITLDFDSVYWNSWGYPIGAIFSRKNRQLSTNFQGRNHIELSVSNTGYRVLTSFFHFKR